MTPRLEEYDVIAVPCDRIYYDGSFNCRGEFTLQSVEALAESIHEIGKLLCPVWLQPAADVAGIPAGYDYRLIAGHRRYRAVTVFLKWPTIPASVFYGLTEWQARKLNFTENLERKDLNPLEEALAIRHLYPDKLPSSQKIADDLKRDQTWVLKRLSVLKVPHEVQQLIAARRVTLLDLQIVLKRDTPEEQIEVAKTLAASKRGRGRNAVFVGEKLARTFKRRKTKTEINGLIAQLFNRDVKNNLAIRIATWCAGSISDEELEADIAADLKSKPPDSL
jgi:ParB/RepB/Spo0J family partition protein